MLPSHHSVIWGAALDAKCPCSSSPPAQSPFLRSVTGTVAAEGWRGRSVSACVACARPPRDSSHCSLFRPAFYPPFKNMAVGRKKISDSLESGIRGSYLPNHPGCSSPIWSFSLSRMPLPSTLPRSHEEHSYLTQPERAAPPPPAADCPASRSPVSVAAPLGGHKHLIT